MGAANAHSFASAHFTTRLADIILSFLRTVYILSFISAAPHRQPKSQRGLGEGYIDKSFTSTPQSYVNMVGQDTMSERIISVLGSPKVGLIGGILILFPLF